MDFQKSPQSSFRELIKLLKRLDLLEAMVAAEIEARVNKPVECSAHDPERASRQMSQLEYSRLLTGLLFWLYTGAKPGGLSSREFQIIRPLCEAFVTNQQLAPEALGVFGSETVDEPRRHSIGKSRCSGESEGASRRPFASTALILDSSCGPRSS